MDWSKEAIMILAQIALLRNVCLTTFAYGRGRTAVVLLVFSLLLPGLAAAESGAQSAARRGKIYFFSKDYDKAYDAFNEAFLADPSNVGVSFYLGRSAFFKGDYEMAIMAFDRVLIMSPDSILMLLSCLVV